MVTIISPRVSETYKSRKKLELLQAAKQVFIAKGFQAATMQDIMDQAGISRGALYGYFDNIEHVYIELLQYEDEQDASYFTMETAESAWPRIEKWVLLQQERIERADQSIVRANSEFFLSENYRKHKERYPYISARYERLVQALSAFLQAGAEQGDFKLRKPAAAISQFIISYIDGLMLDTAHLGTEQIGSVRQLEVFLLALRQLLDSDKEGKKGAGK
ncbi:TetR family transcriptional regulator [Paenibacillus sp. GCM10027626]|uniref:TetR family transcriptional regulator n=1 Tax=Paenibacillus sp. GCM10027626 TaxID=3273411 RepID=UPI0036423F82